MRKAQVDLFVALKVEVIPVAIQMRDDYESFYQEALDMVGL